MGNNCSSCCSPPSSLNNNRRSNDSSCSSSCLNCDENTSCGCCRTCCLPLKRCWDKMFSRGPPRHLPIKPDPDERPKPATQDDPTNTSGTSCAVSEFLSITGWDWCRSENGSAHRTADYHVMDDSQSSGGAVCRRGQAVSLRLTTNRRYDPTKDKVGLVLTVSDSKNPSFGNGTQEGVMVGGEHHEGGWNLQFTDTTDKGLCLQLTPPVTSIVGAWTVEADVSSDGSTHSFMCPYSLYVLFNPWCEDDGTYVAGEEERQEYVLKDTGLIWRGTHTRLRPCPWHFAQFEENILQCVLEILTEVCRMSPPNRADPAKVARAISAGINSPDDKGVLVGNWSGEYEGGSSPTSWNGSVNILTQFYKTKEPVKFGQCWVFSGVVTTACRALGIPCRPVTNFSSAHDTHNSLTIDYFFDDDGETIERLNSDSIWNFHVWNECWMKRPDLGEGYGGWQIVDATPQEESDGQYRCGPTSQIAIKKGQIHMAYDVPFVYAEVNADKLFWKYRGSSQPMKLLGRKTGGVGLKLSTKAVGRYMREDITHQYKHEEDSTDERNVMRDALRRCENVFARYYLNQEVEDLQFEFQLLDDIVIGQPFSMSVIVKNKSCTEYTVSVVLRADATLYTGAVKALVKKQTFDKLIAPNSEETLSVPVTFEEYYTKLADQCSLNVVCFAKLKESDFEYFAQDEFRMRKPDIKITPDGEMKVGKPCACRLSFTNPLPMQLTKGFFYVIATKCKSQYVRIKQAVEPSGEVSCYVTLTPSAAGELTITASFLSRQLEDVDGYLAVEVKECVTKPEGNGSKPEAAVNTSETAVSAGGAGETVAEDTL